MEAQRKRHRLESEKWQFSSATSISRFGAEADTTANSSSGSTLPEAGVPSSPAPPQAVPSEKRIFKQEIALTDGPADSQKAQEASNIARSSGPQ